MTDDLALAILAELRGLRADLRQQHGDRADDLVAALEQFFGPAPFTASGVIEAANTDGNLFDAVQPLVDLDGVCPAVHLGRILARLPGVERAGDKRGVLLFRLRGYPR